MSHKLPKVNAMARTSHRCKHCSLNRWIKRDAISCVSRVRAVETEAELSQDKNITGT